MEKLSPEIVNGLKERGVNLTDEEVKSINTILPNTPQELSMEDLDQAVGGMSAWKKVAIGGGVAAGVVAAALLADAAQSKIRQKDNQAATDNMFSKKGVNAIQGLFSKKAPDDTPNK